jgi:hypothetical protein
MTIDDVMPYLTPATMRAMIKDIEETAAATSDDQNDTCDMIEIIKEFLEQFDHD